MQCPQCQHETAYSWRVYLSHPLCRFTCSECGARYTLVRPRQYYAIAVMYVVFYAGSAFALVNFGSGLFPGVATFTTAYLVHLFACCAAWCYCDRHYEATLPTRLR